MQSILLAKIKTVAELRRVKKARRRRRRILSFSPLEKTEKTLVNGIVKVSFNNAFFKYIECYFAIFINVGWKFARTISYRYTILDKMKTRISKLKINRNGWVFSFYTPKKITLKFTRARISFYATNNNSLSANLFSISL